MPPAPAPLRRLAALAAGIVLVLTLTQCVATTQEKSAVNLSQRPSMETIIDRYTQMRTEAVTRLDAELGPRPWTPDPTMPVVSRAACEVESDGDDGDDGAGESASPQLWVLDGTYEPADWQRALDIVREVGRQHGFETTGTIVDEPGDVKIYGEDQYGGRYYFGMLKASIFSLDTGCHRWDVTPTPVD